MNIFARNALTIPAEAPATNSLDSLIPLRARALGCTDFDSYCDLIDKEATAHLAPGPFASVSFVRSFRRPRPYFDRKTGTHCLSVSINRNRTLYAKVDAADWIEMQEMGVNGVWTASDVGSGRIHVYTKFPMKDWSAIRAVPVARLILGLGVNEQAGFADGDSLNLRRTNLIVTTQPDPDGTRRRARHDARQVARDAVAHRDRLTA